MFVGKGKEIGILLIKKKKQIHIHRATHILMIWSQEIFLLTFSLLFLDNILGFRVYFAILYILSDFHFDSSIFSKHFDFYFSILFFPPWPFYSIHILYNIYACVRAPMLQFHFSYTSWVDVHLWSRIIDISLTASWLSLSICKEQYIWEHLN